jgi:4-methyl-5(b-hydroxyethyl)-thiazole monophosphate biosynthesis
MMARVLIPLATGFEEMEAVITADILRRGGVEVVLAGLQSGPVKGSRLTVLLPDTGLDEALRQDFDAIALPGGQPGADNLKADPRIIALLKKMAAAGKTTAAICAAPLVLAQAGLLTGKAATAYPSTLENMQVAGLAFKNQAVVEDGTLLTSRGPGTAMDFALALLQKLMGKDVRDKVEAALVRDI